MIDSRQQMLVQDSELRTFRPDLDDALVSDESDILAAMTDQVIHSAAAPSGLVSRALTGVDMHRPGAREAANLLLLGCRPATTASYAGKFDRFFRFCVHKQIEQGFPQLCPMPALPSTVLMYLG
jgi:hypothetical protein